MVVMVVIVVVQRLEVSGMSYDDDDSTVLDDDVTDSTQWMCLCLNCKSICSVVVAIQLFYIMSQQTSLYIKDA